MSIWGKIVILYVVAAAVAFGSFASGATQESAAGQTPANESAYSLAQVNLKGGYEAAPLVGDVFFSSEHFRGEFPRLFVQLAALKQIRFSTVGAAEKSCLEELAKLRDEHRSLMNTRNGVGGLDDSFERGSMESNWQIAVTQNVARQAQLKSRLALTAGKWDAENGVVVRYTEQAGKKFLVRMELPEGRVDSVASL